MEPADEPITMRYMRLIQALNGPSIMAQTSFHRELLLDAIVLLFDEYNNDFMRTDELVSNFINKFKMKILELKSLRVNRFDFESKQIIGKGYFGEVELVVEKHTKDIFAMKVLRKHNLLIRKDITGFEYERDIMASSCSPFLTQLHYAFHDYQNLYLVMDYHPGGDFTNLIKRFNGSLPEETAKFYIAELLSAVKHLHSMKFAHCDIKPGNMMLDRVGHLKLVDFGSSAKLDRDGKINAHVHVGTTEYLAPEMILFMQSNSKLKDVYGPLCDMWSVGIVAFEMVTGVTPFSSEQQAVIFSNILNFEKILKYPTSLKVSPSYKQMIECLLCHVDKRFSVDMILDLDIFLMINFNTLNDQAPPYIPALMSDHDVSNFPVHERVRPALNKNDLKNQKQLSSRNLPFMGFTFSRQVPKRNHSYFMTTSPELEASMKIKRKKLEDAEVLIQSLKNKLAENDQLIVEYETKIKEMEEENVLLHVDLTSLKSEIGILTKISKARHEKTYDKESNQAEILKKEIDKREIKTINELMYNIENLKTLYEDLQAQIGELQSKLSIHEKNVEIYQANKEDLNKKIIQVKLHFNQVVQQSNKLNEENNINTYVSTLMNEMKDKEDAFEIEKKNFNSDNQCLQKKIVVMEKRIMNLNLKISQYIDKEILMVSDHKNMYYKLSSEFESKLNILNQEKDNEIEKLHKKISELQQQFSESLNSFEKHENEIFAEEIENELESKLKNREEEIQSLKLDLKILQQIQKTNDDTISSLTNKYKQEISKIQEDTNLQIQNKEKEFKLLHDNIANLNKTNESLQLNLEKETAERSILDKELSKMISQSMIWTHEKSALERQILEYKIKFNNSEANIKTLQGIISRQDEQLSSFEEIVHLLKNKEKQYIDDIKFKQDETQKLLCESQETKKKINTEKSLRLLAESKSKTIESVQDNVKTDLKLLNNQVYEKNIEIASMKDKLNEVNSDLRDKKIMFFTLQIKYEKVIKELTKVKADYTATICQKQMLKDSNIRLNSQVEDMVEDSNFMQSIIYMHQNNLMKQKTFYDERLIKADATILQQTKLNDFLQTKLDKITNKKWSLSDVLFSSKTKENVDQREIEFLLTSEKKKSKDLETKLCHTQTELNIIKSQGLLSTPLAPTCLDFKATSLTYTTNKTSQTPTFHNFEVTICKRNGFLCSHCKSEIKLKQQICQCQECRVSAHIKCLHELLPNCTRSNKEEKPILPNPNECQKSLEIKSWVITWDNKRRIWDRKYAKLEQGLLQIFNNKHDIQPHYSLPLSMTSDIVKIVDVAESNDTTFDKDSNKDYDKMFKIEVYSLDTGWMTFFLYIIVSSVTEKHNWLKTVKEYIEKVECTIQSPDNHEYKDIIYTFKENEVLTVHCVHQISQNIFLLGADEGLFYVHIKIQNEETEHDLIPIVGPKLVTDFVFLKKLQLVLMVAGRTRELLKCDMTTVLNSELSLLSKPIIEAIRIIDKMYSNEPFKSNLPIVELNKINCFATSHCNELVVVGSDHNIAILKWQDTHFVIFKLLKTNIPTKCICFMPTGILFTTKSFYKIETENFSCKRFFTDLVAKLHDYHPMFVCELTNNEEYLLCYNVYGLFVDAHGKKTRNGEMKWPYCPKSFAFKRPFLIIVSESEISIIKITQSCCVDDDKWCITSTKQSNNHLVLHINCPTLLRGSDLFLMNTNDYQGTCTIFKLSLYEIIRRLVTSNGTNLDIQYTCNTSESSVELYDRKFK